MGELTKPQDPGQLRVLGLLNAHSKSVTAGIEPGLLRQRCTQLSGGSDDGIAAIQALLQQGWLERNGTSLRLSAAGYASLLALPVQTWSTALAPAVAPPRTEGPRSEYTLRNDVLAIYAQENARSGQALGEDSLQRYWLAAGRRSEELRHALDILMRDQQVSTGTFRKSQLSLTEGGERYLKGRSAPPGLKASAPAADAEDRSRKTLAETALLLLAVYLFRRAQCLPPASLSYDQFCYVADRLGLPAFLLFHAFELLHRLGYANPAPATSNLELVLTPEGMDLLEQVENGKELKRLQKALAEADLEPPETEDSEESEP